MTPIGENLAKKIFKIQQEVKTLEKTERNKAQNYDYVSSANAVGYMRKVLFDNKLLVVPSGVDSIEFRDTTGKMFVTTVTTSYLLRDMESGESTIVKWAGSGADTGDNYIFQSVN